MPVHVHADEEEFFYVLGGSGLSWQDGRTYGVGAGGCLVHRPSAESHTIVAGDDGLDVLAFSSGSDTELTWLPRADAWWLGPRWLPSDGPNPFEREAAAGELELRAPEPPRAPAIIATQDVPSEAMRHGSVDSQWRELGIAAGSVLSGMSHVEVAPRGAGLSLPLSRRRGGDSCRPWPAKGRYGSATSVTRYAPATSSRGHPRPRSRIRSSRATAA